MMAARVSCRSCHRLREVSPTGAVLWKSSAGVCSMCHEESEVERLRAYHEAFRAAEPQMESALSSARKALASAKLSADRAAALAKELDRIHSDLEFVRKGNDIHNIHYASKLMRTLLEQLRGLCRELHAPQPKVDLPPTGKKWP
jgi:predicted CXXCH cytochrome family protein